MSTYDKITRHPQNRTYEVATYHDDYFGPHLYGVEFLSDGKVYPIEIVERNQIYDFWKDDVINAFCEMTGDLPTDSNIVEFLDEIEKAYQKRWEEDPITGNGATKLSQVTKKLS